VNVGGCTESGEHLTGTEWVDQEKAVRQEPLDRDTYCAKVQAGARLAGDSTESGQSYEWNMILRNDCGG
jgi:hypothetical protein